MYKLKIKIVNSAFCVNTQSYELFNCLEKKYSQFAGGEKPKFSLIIELSEKLQKKKHYKNKLNNGKLIINSKIYQAVLNLNTSNGRLITTPQSALISTDNVLRNLFSYFIIKQRGLLLHACAIVRDNMAYLFFGPSGSGKSTVVNFSDGFKILGDDIIPIMKEKSCFKAYGAPFISDKENIKRIINSSFKISGIFQLIKDKKTYLKKLDTPQAVSKIFTMPGFKLSSKQLFKLMDLFTDLCAKIPCYEIHFKKDASFWKEIEKLNLV